MSVAPVASYRLSAIHGTPYPNKLLDLSYTLPETQLRILNLIVRNTLGWQSDTPGYRRAQVQISLNQIKKKIERVSMTPVIEALYALMQAGIVEGVNLDDSPLDMYALSRKHYRPVRLSIARAWVEEDVQIGG